MLSSTSPYIPFWQSGQHVLSTRSLAMNLFTRRAPAPVGKQTTFDHLNDARAGPNIYCTQLADVRKTALLVQTDSAACHSGSLPQRVSLRHKLCDKQLQVKHFRSKLFPGGEEQDITLQYANLFRAVPLRPSPLDALRDGIALRSSLKVLCFRESRDQDFWDHCSVVARSFV